MTRVARRQPLATISALFLFILLLVVALGSHITPYPPLEQDTTAVYQAPSSSHWLGTDWIGRDLLSRIMVGARVSLAVGFGAVLIGTTAGALWGLFSGYAGGTIDLISQRLLEILMALPGLVLAIALAAGLGQGVMTVIIAVAITRVAQTARVVRSSAITIRGMDYVDAARTIGANPLRIVLRHVAPGTASVFLVLLTAHVGVAIILEGTLGFLGVGIVPPTVSWGTVLSGILSYSRDPAWWVVVYPGAAITVTALAFNLLGDGLRDLLDPRLRGTGR